VEPVHTRKLDNEVIYVIANVTQEMMIGYVLVAWPVLWAFTRPFVGNLLLQMAIPLPIIVLVIHPVVTMLSDLAVTHKAVLSIRFALKADRYVWRPDPMPLPAIIPRTAMRFRHRSKRRPAHA
jgi:hypothetical protein